jgi:hypothetical protein
MIWFSTPEREVIDHMSADLRIMQHLLERSISRHVRNSGVDQRMGIPMLLDHREANDNEAPVYIEGLGAVFSVSVDIPLAGPQPTQGKIEPEPKDVDSEWERAKAELSAPATGAGAFASPSGGGLAGSGMAGQAGPTFDSSRVEQLKRTLVRALRNGVNLRGVKPDEWIVVVLTGSPDTDSLTLLQQSAVAALKKDPLNGWPGTVPTTWWGAGRSTVMTIRVKMSDAGSISAEDRDALSTEVKSLSVNTYYGGRTIEGVVNMLLPASSGAVGN